MKTKQSPVLGPYNRYILWVQGCNRHCEGCIAKDSWDMSGGMEIAASELENEILSTENIEGITISGGEPFLQAEELCTLLKGVKTKRDLGVIVYTGYKFAEIKDSPLTALCDLVIDGEYIDGLNDNLSLRGSSNQNVIEITDRYSNVVGKYYGRQGRKTEILFDKDGVRLVGIPRKEELNLYKGVK